MEPILRFENVSKHYPNGVHALKGVSFEMADCMIVMKCCGSHFFQRWV